LRLKKVRLSIDDFGTGYSNLSQLRDLPFDELKLDRSYVHGGEDWKRAAAILESSVDIAKKLGMTIVAEGVETLDDWRWVERLGCDQVQGWFTAKPMPGDQIQSWIESWPETCRGLFAAIPET
jgi:EAL domain-containing protein (putative c-di-GMP-specific phosphodiesterase class I)